MIKFKAKCINNAGCEWLLDVGAIYDILAINHETIMIAHPRRGAYGLDRSRFRLTQKGVE